MPGARRIGVVGVPTSAGAFAPGQEQAPAALRAAGLAQMLEAGGAEVHDRGDREPWAWRPDRSNPRAQNAAEVAEFAGDTARRAGEAISDGEMPLVLGGDCTVGVGAVAAQVATGERVGVVYFDAHADLNVPESVSEGALDWMGMSHMLGEPGTIPAIASLGERTPLLAPEQVVVFGWDPVQATDHERTAIERTGLRTVPADEVEADPEAAALRVREMVEPDCERLLVHFDVDVIDFTDLPLSENWGRNVGLSYDAAMRALAVLLASPRLAGVTVTELNPDHARAEPGGLERFAEELAQALGRDPG